MAERRRMIRGKEQGIEKRARFDIIRYANCWEDADILIKALNVKQDGAYLSIASSGDNSLALLSRNPDLVLAVDINPAQLACVEIRKAAFKNLSYEELLEFLGVREHKNRIGLYQRIYRDLPDEIKSFWDARLESIGTGIIHIGKFENYFRLFRKYVLPLVHNRKDVERLLNTRDREERIDFYNHTWNSLTWRMLFKIFFSRGMMGKLGRDAEFFKYVETDVAERIFKRAEYALTVLPTDNNPYLEYILRGNFKHTLPFYLRRENFEAIRGNLERLVVFKGNLQEAFQINPRAKFDGFNLSDIFEYMSYNQYEEELKHALNFAKTGARLVYWNMLAERKSAGGLEDKLGFLDNEAEELFKQDKAFFYKSLIIGEAR